MTGEERQCTATNPCEDRLDMADNDHAYIEGQDDEGDWWIAGSGGLIVAVVYHCPWCGGRLA